MIKTQKLVSVIIPTYNEERVIGDCLQSLQSQSYGPLEIIVVDDGSTENTFKKISNFKFQISNFKVIGQDHQGPGSARNLGASNALGEILVFVDADMIFNKDFITDLVKPIIKGETIGTFSKNEMVANEDNIWSICWNINKNLPVDRMIADDYPDEAPVFRAILKKKFEEVGGFDTNGQYTDDWSLSRKLGIKSAVAHGAVYYHSNPSTLMDIWRQARWIGKNEFISGSLIRKLRSLILYSFPISFLIGLYKSIVKGQWLFVFFKFYYDHAIWVSVVKSFFGESKFK